MNVVAFPTRTATIAEPAPISHSQDFALFELLRKAVAAHRTGATKSPGSTGHRRQLDIANAYLDAACILTGQPDARIELTRALAVSTFDLRKLANIARNPETPQPA